MHLCSRLLSRPSTSNPLDNGARLMANISQAQDLEGIHRDVHGTTKQIRIMNEINALLSCHSTSQGHSSRNRPHQLASLHSRRGRSPIMLESRSSSRTQNMMGAKTRRRGRSPRQYDQALKRCDKFTTQKIKDLNAQIDAINTGANASVTVDTLIRQTEPPFTERVMKVRVLCRFKLPSQLGVYEGKIDPMDHLNSYKAPRIFGRDGESLKIYVKRFNQAVLEVEDPSDKVVVMAMTECLPLGPLFDSLFKSVPETLLALQSKAYKYITAEELTEDKCRRQGKDDHKRKEPDSQRTYYRVCLKVRGLSRMPEGELMNDVLGLYLMLPPLNAPIAQVLMETKNEDFMKCPRKIKTNPFRRNKNKYCEFHNDHGYNTEDCFQLKEQIDDLIKRGYLRKFVADCPRHDSPKRGYADNKLTTSDT
ncbi:hypothetical protein Acr_17g0011260 [Actinidia rufa]|uniref:Uncharacterized protein n=1 Tax=Actinidia rufa TaxID=165716 RepID=A0A7J0G436_9ERIC|nr:hypothetical protein Acr_17g0011260 [Actinidia rufa]